jgi:hypothetical protein
MIGPDGTEYKWVIGYTKPEVAITMNSESADGH